MSRDIISYEVRGHDLLRPCLRWLHEVPSYLSSFSSSLSRYDRPLMARTQTSETAPPKTRAFLHPYADAKTGRVAATRAPPRGTPFCFMLIAKALPLGPVTRRVVGQTVKQVVDESETPRLGVAQAECGDDEEKEGTQRLEEEMVDRMAGRTGTHNSVFAYVQFGFALPLRIRRHGDSSSWTPEKEKRPGGRSLRRPPGRVMQLLC